MCMPFSLMFLSHNLKKALFILVLQFNMFPTLYSTYVPDLKNLESICFYILLTLGCIMTEDFPDFMFNYPTSSQGRDNCMTDLIDQMVSCFGNENMMQEAVAASRCIRREAKAMTNPIYLGYVGFR